VLVGDNATLPARSFAVTREELARREDAPSRGSEARLFIDESFARYHAEI
jgi:hypothetical protein